MASAVDRRAFTLFDAWRNLASSDRDPCTDTREAIARGQEDFKTGIDTIENVRSVCFAVAAAISGARCAKAGAAELNS